MLYSAVCLQTDGGKEKTEESDPKTISQFTDRFDNYVGHCMINFLLIRLGSIHCIDNSKLITVFTKMLPKIIS